MRFLWRFSHFVSVLVALLLAGCVQSNNRIDKVWFFTLYTSSGSDKDSMLTPASFLNLQEDGSYTTDFGQFESGNWKSDNKTLQLTREDHTSTEYTIEYLAKSEMRISSKLFPSTSFESQPGVFKSSSENPFSKENNLWRIHAMRKENDGEIKSRLRNHMKFWELYFSWALNSDISSIDVRSTPTPIKIYGNGFELKPFNDLPAAWRSYFFDEEDCRKANGIIKSVFDKRDIAWAHTENKYKLFISAFQQLQQFLK